MTAGESQPNEIVGEDAVITFGMCHLRDVRRPLHAHERSILDVLLKQPFEDSELWRAQIAHLEVTVECETCPSVSFQAAAPVQPVLDKDGKPRRGVAPFELNGRDEDGMFWQALILMSAGVISDLDAFRGDSSSFLDVRWWEHGQVVEGAEPA